MTPSDCSIIGGSCRAWRAGLFENDGRPAYCRLRLPVAEVKDAIFGHREFAAFQNSATALFTD
jgi:type I restriction enzyme M protein